jgi:hypothetical protein
MQHIKCYHPLISKRIPWTIPIYTNESIRVQKQKMNPTQRVNVDTHKTMNFTITKNIGINKYNINYAVINAIAK